MGESQKRLGGKGEFWPNFEEVLGVSKEKTSKGHCSLRVSPGQRSGDQREQKHIWKDRGSSVQVECRKTMGMS